MSDLRETLTRAERFLSSLPGEAGLTAVGVDRLCAILLCGDLRDTSERRHFETDRPVRQCGSEWQYVNETAYTSGKSALEPSPDTVADAANWTPDQMLDACEAWLAAKQNKHIALANHVRNVCDMARALTEPDTPQDGSAAEGE